MSIAKVRKAVFPVAGFGTRFLPATKASPKEMLPVVDKPIIQYAFEEAVAAGITEMIFVTSTMKHSIEDHFDTNFELESALIKSEKKDLLKIVQGVCPKHIHCFYVRQHERLGLGHAVLCAKPIVEDEPFAVILADDLVDSKTPCLKQLIDIYEQKNASVIAVEPVEKANLKSYGVVDVKGEINPFALLKGIVEKPNPEDAPSNYGVIGRYILKSRIFDLLEKTQKGSGGEIQLTDAIAALLKEDEVYALHFEGKRYDCGSKLGYLHATIEYALKHPEVGERFRKLLEKYR
jgi:UTP--glucose-1-phosphate uridylyltransferase